MDRNTVLIDHDNGSCILAQVHLPPMYCTSVLPMFYKFQFLRILRMAVMS